MKHLKQCLQAATGLTLAIAAGLLLMHTPAQPAQAQDEQDFVWAPDFPVGSQMIDISASDQNGDIKTFDDLKGEKGLLFLLSRSFDW